MFFTVYKVTNKINGKTYIGSHKTRNLDDGYMGSGKYLKRAIIKHGVENFEKEILHVFETAEEMYAKEAELVNEDYLTDGNTYNLKIGGEGGFDYINSNPEIIAKYTPRKRKATGNYLKALKKQKELMDNSPEYREKVKKSISSAMRRVIAENGHWWVGRKHKTKTKTKIGVANSINQSGVKNSQYGSVWITNGINNRKIKSTESIPDKWSRGRTIHP